MVLLPSSCRSARRGAGMFLAGLMVTVAACSPGGQAATPVRVTMPTPAAPPPLVVASPPPGVGSIRISTPASPKSARRAFDEAAGEIGGGWARRAEPGAPSQPNALCQSGGQASLMLLGDTAATSTDRFADGKVQAALRSGPAGPAGVVLRAQDQSTFYLIRFDAAAGTVGFYRVANGAETRVVEAPAAVSAGTWGELRATMSDNTVFVWLNNRQILSGADDAIAKPGLAGLWAAGGSGACFDDALVEWR